MRAGSEGAVGRMGLRGALGGGGDLTNALLLLALETFILVPPVVATSLHYSHQCDCYEVIFPSLILEFGNTEGLWPGCGDSSECGRHSGR